MLRDLAVADASADPFALTLTVPDIDLRDLHVKQGLNRLADLDLVGTRVNLKYLSIEHLDTEGRFLCKYGAQQYAVV